MSAIALVARQAEAEGLWFDATQITEQCLQKALRELHEAVEQDHREAMRGHPASSDGPYVVQECAHALGTYWVATDPTTGIVAAGPDKENATHIAVALNTEHARCLNLLRAIQQVRDAQACGYDALASSFWDTVCEIADRMSNTHNPRVDHRNPTQ